MLFYMNYCGCSNTHMMPFLVQLAEILTQHITAPRVRVLSLFGYTEEQYEATPAVSVVNLSDLCRQINVLWQTLWQGPRQRLYRTILREDLFKQLHPLVAWHPGCERRRFQCQQNRIFVWHTDGAIYCYWTAFFVTDTLNVTILSHCCRCCDASINGDEIVSIVVPNLDYKACAYALTESGVLYEAPLAATSPSHPLVVVVESGEGGGWKRLSSERVVIKSLVSSSGGDYDADDFIFNAFPMLLSTDDVLYIPTLNLDGGDVNYLVDARAPALGAYWPMPTTADPVVSIHSFEDCMIIALTRSGDCYGIHNRGREVLGLSKETDDDDNNEGSHHEVWKKLPVANIVRVACGERHTLLLDRQNKLWGSGYGDEGCLGLPNMRAEWIDGKLVYPPPLAKFTQIPVNVEIVDIACGRAHSVLLSSTGTIHVAGCDKYGQLGLEPKRYAGNVHVFTEVPLPQCGRVFAVQCGRESTVVAAEQGLFETYNRVRIDSLRYNQAPWGFRCIALLGHEKFFSQQQQHTNKKRKLDQDRPSDEEVCRDLPLVTS
jgi:hypothetical protein